MNHSIFTVQLNSVLRSPASLLGFSLLTLLPWAGMAQIPVSDPQVFEGTTGTRNMDFRIRIFGPRDTPVTGRFSTLDSGFGSGVHATAGNACGGNVDYIRQTGVSFTIPAGAESTTISVPICGDTSIEPNETLTVVLADVVGAQCNTDTCFGIGAILNDDGLPSISINDITIQEPSASVRNAKFTVTLNHPTPVITRVRFHTRDGTAVGGSCNKHPLLPIQSVDYKPGAGILTIPPNRLSAKIAVPICPDQLLEPVETFFMVLSNPQNATIADTEGRATIQNAAGVP